MDNDESNGNDDENAKVLTFAPLLDATTSVRIYSATPLPLAAKDEHTAFSFSVLTSANVFFLENGVGRESEGDLPGKLSMTRILTV